MKPTSLRSGVRNDEASAIYRRLAWGFWVRAPLTILVRLGLAMLAVLLGTGAFAQTPSASSASPKPGERAPVAAPVSVESRVAYDEAFQATLNKPADPATLLKFAGLAVQIGDLEGAISVLERLLLIDGDQPEIKLELGVLYFRLGSNEMARAYLVAARDAASASIDIKKQADTFLREGVRR